MFNFIVTALLVWAAGYGIASLFVDGWAFAFASQGIFIGAIIIDFLNDIKIQLKRLNNEK